MNPYFLILLALYGIMGGLLGLVIDIKESPWLFLAIVGLANVIGIVSRLDVLYGPKDK